MAGGSMVRQPKATAKDRQQDKKINKLTRLVNTRELKFQDIAGVAVVPTWAGLVTNLFAPAEGDTDTGRAGDKVLIEKIDFKINGGMTAAGTNQIRVMIIRDKGFGIGTTAANVLDAVALGTVNACHAPLEEDYFPSNFEVLYDKTVIVDSITKYQFQLRFTKKLKKKCQFLANTTALTMGQIKVVLVSDALAPNIGVDYYSRIWFSDL